MMQEEIKMQGGMKRLFHLVDEGTKVSSALQELIDNSIDANANKIDITISNGGGVEFEYTDNGCGMDSDKVEGFVTKFSVNDSDAFERSEGQIGYFGCGMKDTFIKLANHAAPNGANVTLHTWPSPDDMSRISLLVSDNDEYAFLNPDVVQLRESSKQCKDLVTRYGEHGTDIKIDRIKSEIIGNDVTLPALREIIESSSKAYMFINSINPLNISYKVVKGGKEVISDKLPFSSDDMLLKYLHDNNEIDEPGVYEHDGNFFVVRKYTLAYGDKRRVVKVIFLYSKKELSDRGGSGMYAIYHNRYITWPEGANRQMPFNTTNRGGQGRMRFVVFADGNEDILSLRSNKSAGIDITETNLDLAKYHVVGEGKKSTLTSAIEDDFHRLYNLHIFKTKGIDALIKAGQREERTVTVELLKKIMKGEHSPVTAMKEYDKEHGFIAATSCGNSDAKPVNPLSSNKSKAVVTVASDTVVGGEDITLRKMAEEEMTRKSVVIFTKSSDGVTFGKIDEKALPPMVNLPVTNILMSVINKKLGKSNLTQKLAGELINDFVNEMSNIEATV